MGRSLQSSHGERMVACTWVMTVDDAEWQALPGCPATPISDSALREKRASTVLPGQQVSLLLLF